MSLPNHREIADLYRFCTIYEHLLAGANQSEASQSTARLRDDALPEEERSTSDSTSKLFTRLKERYGIDFAVRGQGGLEATEEGEAFWARARKLLQEYQNLTDPIPRSTVYISTIDAGAHFWIPKAVAKPLSSHSHICLRIQVRQWWEVLRDVRSGLADFGLATEYVDDSVDHEPLLERDHRLIVPKQHRFAKQSVVELSHLGGETVVCMHTMAGPVAVEHQLRAHNINAQLIVVETAAQVLAWIEEGCGIGFLPEEMVPDEFHKCSVRPGLAKAVDVIYTRKTAGKKGRSLPAEAGMVLDWIQNYWRGEHRRKAKKK